MHESADKPAHLTWFERLYSIATTLEKSLLYPFIFVTGLTFTQAELLNKWGIYFAVLLQAVAGLKLFRQSFGIVISQFLLLTYCEILIELFDCFERRYVTSICHPHIHFVVFQL